MRVIAWAVASSGLVAVGAALVAFGLGFASAVDLLGEPGWRSGGDALVGGGCGRA